MKKSVRSTKTPAKSKSSQMGALNNPGPVVPESRGTASRQQVRQEIHRTNVPRQSQRPAERSNQRRSSKP